MVSVPSSMSRHGSYHLSVLQEVFPVQYGTKYDTALQALIAGLVYKLEQLLPVPNLSQVGPPGPPVVPAIICRPGHIQFVFNGSLLFCFVRIMEELV